MQVELTKNYFELFNFPVSFDVDVEEMTHRYRDLQRALHPDKYANATDRERMLSVQQTSLLNEAHTTLKDPLLRARYILKLSGMEINNEPNTVRDTTFLMQQMELREQLAEIKGHADPLGELDKFIAVVKNETNQRIEKLKVLFADLSEEHKAQAYDVTQQMKFLKK